MLKLMGGGGCLRRWRSGWCLGIVNVAYGGWEVRMRDAEAVGILGEVDI